MKSVLASPFLTAFGLTAVLSFSGCATGPAPLPIYQAPNFSYSDVDVIAILPAADLRRDKSADINVNKIAQDMAQTALKHRDYSTELTLEPVDYSHITEEDLANPSAAWVKHLPPSDKRWVLIVCADDITRKLTFGSTGNAAVSAYFYDKKAGVLIWRDKGVGQAGQGGLLGMAMIGMMSQAALENAVNMAFLSFPPKDAK